MIIPQGTVIHYVEPAPEIDPSAVSTMTFVYMGADVYLDVFLVTGQFHRVQHFPPRNDIFEIHRQLLEAK